MPVFSERRYARNGALHIAYEVVGDGPIDLLYLAGGNTSIDSFDEEPRLSRFGRRLASFTRLIRMDFRGVGLSDPISPSQPQSVEERVGDALAVLDAVGSERTAVYGSDEGALVGMVMAATHPHRIAALVLFNAFARQVRDDDYPWGVPRHLAEAFAEGNLSGEIDAAALFAPSSADDQYRQWHNRAGRRGASPATARALFRLRIDSDVRSVLPSIQAPTLVLHRRDNPLTRVGHGRYLAEQIPNATLVELPGDEHIAFLGDSDAVLDEIQEFLTGVRHPAEFDRALATVLFTDIVDSTGLAAEIGDRAWRALLDSHDLTVRRQLQRFAGQEIKTIGDSFLATFDGPARAIHCARAIVEATYQLGIRVRTGMHCGEVELLPDDIGGLAVNIAKRITDLAEPGEVLVSSTVKDLVAGSGLAFTDRGTHVLRGVPDEWRLFAVDSG